MEYMKSIPDKYFELAIADPPYGIYAAKKPISMGAWKRDIHESKEWDNTIPSKEYFNELTRVSKNQIIWGGNYFLDFLGATRCMVVWDKNNGTNMMADCELAWTSFNSSVRKFTRSHIDDHNQGIERIHPTQKPVKLYEWLLKNYAKEGDKILDTHLGSGSSAIACHNMGFEFVGCELDTDYFKAAQERFNNHAKQERMDI
jgi:site-specific DNA-methyltransferase (adenine-specific)